MKSSLSEEQLAAVEKWRERKFPKGMQCPLCHATSMSCSGPTDMHPDVTTASHESTRTSITIIAYTCDYCGHVMSFALGKVERTAAL
jgi:hypothetical protein